MLGGEFLEIAPHIVLSTRGKAARAAKERNILKIQTPGSKGNMLRILEMLTTPVAPKTQRL